MYLFDEYQNRAEYLFEGFEGVDAKILGWSADYPQSLNLHISVDPLSFLMELEGSTLGSPDEIRHTNTPLQLLAVADLEWRFAGELIPGRYAADIPEALSEYQEWRWEEALNPIQREAYDYICNVIDALYEGLKSDWDLISSASFELGQSETVTTPPGINIQNGWEVTLQKGGGCDECITLSQYCREEPINHEDMELIVEGKLFGGELEMLIEDEKGVEIETISTDGVLLWKDDTELAAIINHILKERLLIEEKEAA